MPLYMMPCGEYHTIKKVSGRDEIRRHLARLGFVVGERVMIVNRLGKNIILSVKGTRIALDPSLASCIIV